MPYLLLILLGVALLAILRRREDAPWVVALLILTGGAIGIGDLFLSALGEMYLYRTGLMPPPEDTYLGMLLGDKLFAPLYTAALLPGFLNRSPLAAGWAALPVGLIEVEFHRMGLFEYRRWYLAWTVIWFAAFYVGAAAWLGRLRHDGYTPFHRALLLVGATGYGFHLWGLIGQLLMRLYELRPYWHPDPMKDRVIGGTVFFGVPYMAVAFAIIWMRKGQSLPVMAAAWAAFALWFTFLRQWGLWVDGEDWSPLLEAIAVAMLISLTGLIDQWLSAAIARQTA